MTRRISSTHGKPQSDLTDACISRLTRRTRKLRILVFYGGPQGTKPREDLLAWLRAQNVEPLLVRDDVPSEARVVTESVNEAIERADAAIAILTPDARSTHGAPNVIGEIQRWAGRRSPTTILVLRHVDVQKPSNDGGIVQPEFTSSPTEVVTAISAFLSGVRSKEAWGYVVLNETKARKGIQPYVIVGAFEVHESFALRGSGWAVTFRPKQVVRKWTNWVGSWRNTAMGNKIEFLTSPLAHARKQMAAPPGYLPGQWMFDGQIGNNSYEGRLVHNLPVKGLKYGNKGTVHVWKLDGAMPSSMADVRTRVLALAQPAIAAFRKAVVSR